MEEEQVGRLGIVAGRKLSISASCTLGEWFAGLTKPASVLFGIRAAIRVSASKSRSVDLKVYERFKSLKGKENYLLTHP